ncbi:MAG TPA: GntR family transcriptional regulator [Bryobacteraceae bacterium]|nr:GntR family transcriptional regulator [Bryobacteraceae bacterium]
MDAKTDRVRKRVEPECLAAEAYSTVRERIIHGQLAIGQIISRRKLAVELGMSLLPVSEALIRLQHEGLLESQPRVGTRVRVPTPRDVEGHYVIREALESQAAMLFASHATPEERAELMEMAARVDELCILPDGDRFVYSRLHDALHRRIAECARCESLAELISRISALAATWLCATRRSSRANPPTHHQDLMKVLVSESPAAAAEAMRAHIRFSKESALRRLDLYFRLQKQYPQKYTRNTRKSLSLESFLFAESAASYESTLV